MKRSQIKRRPLSDTVLENLEPESKEYREHDGGGLYFRVKPDGKKSWTFRYKKPSGKWGWAGVGSYPSVSGSLARKKVEKLKADLIEGNDITDAARSRRQALQQASEDSFESLANEWLAARRPGWTEGTYIRAVGGLKLHVFPVVGSRPFVSIHPMEWMDVFRAMEKKGVLEQMAQVRRYCKEIYDLARVTGRATHNPVDGLQKFLQTNESENYAHVTAADLPGLLKAINGYPHARDVRIGLKLLVLLAPRPTELREAFWSEFNFEDKLWIIPGSAMKKRREHLVPLSRQAIENLLELRELTGGLNRLFPGRMDIKKPRSNMVFNMALRRLGYGGRQTGHGFRHIASTILREHGFDEDHVEAQLSHIKRGVAGVYNKAIYLEPRRKMMQWYADHLDALEKGNIVPFGNPAQR